MKLKLLTADIVRYLHGKALEETEEKDLAGIKPVELVLDKIETRVKFGFVRSAHELAATYAVMLAGAGLFLRGNKRTAFLSMKTCLALNSAQLTFDGIESSDLIDQAAQGVVDEAEFANWLRAQS